MRAPSVWIVSAGRDDLGGEVDHVTSPPTLLQQLRAELVLGVPAAVAFHTAMVIGVLSLSLRRPDLRFMPPRKLWSNSTTGAPSGPPICCRWGAPSLRRSLCNQAHAVSYDPNPSTSLQPLGRHPVLLRRHQPDRGEPGRERRVGERWKIVPAVTEVFSAALDTHPQIFSLFANTYPPPAA